MPPKFKKPPSSSSSSSAKQKSSGPRVLYWFRTDLRIHDSPALHAALALNPGVFIPIWTWDPHYIYRARVGPNRFRFLLECQTDLSTTLTKLNKKQKLHVIREAPTTVIPKLVKKWGITHLVFEKDTDAYAKGRDDEVAKKVKELGLDVEVIVEMGRTLFDPDEIVKANGGEPTMSMNQLVNAASKIGDGKPKKPVPTPDSIPDPLDEKEMDLTELDHEVPEKAPDFNEVHRLAEEEEKHYESIMGPKKDFAVVTLEEMGMDPASAPSPHKGGETEALKLLKKYIDDEDWMGNFEKPKSAPTDFEPQSTTLLSPHHHFGSLSIRKFWWDVQDVFERRKKAGKHVASEPANMPGQLLFRDMYFAAQAALGYSYAQTEGNKIARFIPWHLQSNYSSEPLGEHLLDGTYNVDDEDAELYFRRWKEGRTGFPWIDALMRQLKQEGWIHHLGRHAVACFLTRGGCYVHWERGAEVFEEYLIDHETACNVGNWMWLSCTAFFSQFYRCYSPIAFPKKWDPNGDFVRKYIPELAHYDKKYIYEPHKAPIADQKKWKCQIKTLDDDDNDDDNNNNKTKKEEERKGEMTTYPKPMFDFNERRQYCLDKMKEAYDAKIYGDDERVMNGKWKEMFGYPDVKGSKASKGKMEVKDEANGKVGPSKEKGGSSSNDKKTKKRARSSEETDDGDDDGGTDGDVGDRSADEKQEEEGGEGKEEDNKKPVKRKVQKVGDGDKDTKGGKGGVKQATLDTVVRKKKAK